MQFGHYLNRNFMQGMCDTRREIVFGRRHPFISEIRIDIPGWFLEYDNNIKREIQNTASNIYAEMGLSAAAIQNRDFQVSLAQFLMMLFADQP